MRSMIVCAAALLFLGTDGLQAQPPFGRGHDDQTFAERKTQFLTGRLSLSDTQRQQVLTLFTTADQNSEGLENKLAQARRSLRDATRRNAPYSEIDQLSATIGFLVGQVEAIQAKADTAFYNLLTAEQRQKMDRGHGGRGGPGGPHFPMRR